MSRHPFEQSAFPPDPAHSRQHFKPPPWRCLPQYRVVLRENAEKEMMFVVRTIMELTRFCRTEATYKMWQAHYDGKSILVVTHKERAELYVELFADRGVQVGLEPN